jgi:hypothetical protein
LDFKSFNDREGLAMKINKYVVELWHEPGMSPLSNAASRRMSNHTHQVLPGLMEAREMKMVGAYHLDPEHRSILIFEAKTAEDVRDVLYESGFMHWCDGRIFPSTPLPEMHKWAVAQEPM